MKLLARALRLFGDIKDDEVARVTRLMASLFCLMWGYYVLKTVREPLILATGGAEMKAYASGVQAVTMIFAVGVYSRLAARLDKERLIRGVLRFFLLCLVGFGVAAWLRTPLLGFIFYVWVGIFSLTTIAQFWSLANDLYTREAGERLFPIIAIGQATGAVVGSELAEWMFERGLGVAKLLGAAAVLIVVHLLLYRLNELSPKGRSVPPPADAPSAVRSGFTLVVQNPYLRLLGVLLVLLNLVNTTGEYILSKVALQTAEQQLAAALSTGQVVDRAAFIDSSLGAFYGSFFSDVNVVVIGLQTLFVSRLVRVGGFRGAIFALPLVAFGTYAAAGAGVGVLAFRWLKLAENSTDYSVMNTAKAMAWLPTTRAEKYRAKQALDTFFVRFGDVLSAGVVFLGAEWLMWDRGSFAWFNVVVVLLWLALTVAIAQHYQEASYLKEVPES